MMFLIVFSVKSICSSLYTCVCVFSGEKRMWLVLYKCACKTESDKCGIRAHLTIQARKSSPEAKRAKCQSKHAKAQLGPKGVEEVEANMMRKKDSRLCSVVWLLTHKLKIRLLSWLWFLSVAPFERPTSERIQSPQFWENNGYIGLIIHRFLYKKKKWELLAKTGLDRSLYFFWKR